MYYLTPRDFKSLIQADHLAVITQGDDQVLEKAERAAKEEMAAYLRGRFNVVKIFIPVQEYDPDKTYNTGDHVYFETTEGDPETGQVYKAKEGTTGVNPTDEDKWEVGDDRNHVIVMYLADITLYHLHSAINPRNIPELRGIRYDAAREWLRDVSRTIINPDLPLLTEVTDKVPLVRYGGQTKRTNDY